MDTYISSGRSGTPTVTGRFTIGTKYKAQRMTGRDYDLPGVPWVMYFHSGYAIHGAYGTPTSAHRPATAVSTCVSTKLGCSTSGRPPARRYTYTIDVMG